jgi:hypothetical protein
VKRSRFGIELLEPFAGGVQLGPAHVRGGVEDLALDVGEVHDVEIDNAECADAGRRQVERQGRTQTARADAQHARLLQLLLPLQGHLGHDEVTAVA